jgi:hypothetical protein
MKRSVGWCLFIVLTAISLLHVYWGVGGLWPADTVRGLIDTVMGDPRMDSMPPLLATLIVAALIFAAGGLALERAGITRSLPEILVKLGTWVLVLIFGLRGLSSFLFAGGVYGNEITLSEPFATYDVWFYGPLCLFIGFGFLYLSLTKTSS